MKLVVPGGSGQVGRLLTAALAEDGHELVVLPRTPGDVGPAPVRQVVWDGRSVGTWAAELEGAAAVINLAGRSVNCRYTPSNRRAILESRIESTRAVGEAIASCADPPRVWLQAGTATIYAHRYDTPNDERTGLLGGSEPGVPETWRFSVDVALRWEEALEAAQTPRTRKVSLRTGIVMNPQAGSAFDILLSLVRRGLGGASGHGRQYVSWIHHDDLVRAVRWLLDHDLEGPVNVAAPHPVPNAEFMRALRDAWGRSFGLPAARWMLEIGAVFLRTETELVLKSRLVVPTRLTEAGFEFSHPSWPAAARTLCAEWRELHGR